MTFATALAFALAAPAAVIAFTGGPPSSVCNLVAPAWLSATTMCSTTPSLNDWSMTFPATYTPGQTITLTLQGSTKYIGFSMVSSAGTLATTSPSLKVGPSCAGKGTISHSNASDKTGGSFVFTPPASGSVSFVVIVLRQRGVNAGSDCAYQVIEGTINAAGTTTTTTTAAPTTTTTTTAPTTTTTTTVAPGTTTTTTTTTTTAPGVTTTTTIPLTTVPGTTTTTTTTTTLAPTTGNGLSTECEPCFLTPTLVDAGTIGSSKWCSCCANDCGGIFPDCVVQGWCKDKCLDLDACDEFTTAPTTSTEGDATTTASGTVTVAEVSADDDDDDSTTKPSTASVVAATSIATLASAMFAAQWM